MPVETITLKPKHIFHHKVEGYLIASDLNQYIENFWLDKENFASKVNIIWDLREAKLSNFSFETVEYLANSIGDKFADKYKPGLTAFLLNDTPEKHIASYLASLLGSIQKNRKIELFHEYDQALTYVDDSNVEA